MRRPRLLMLLFLLLAHATAARAGPVIATLSEDSLNARLEEIHAFPAIGARIDAVSELFLGTPYVALPLGEGGEGPEPQARFRLDGVDCQTFVETVLALANSRSTAQSKLVLDDIRYGKEPLSFATRNHFTESQWLPANIEKGYVREAVAAIDGNAPKAELTLVKALWSKLPGLKRLEDAEIPQGRFGIRYLPLADFRKRLRSIEPGTILLVVREADPGKVVRVSHMGFLLQSRGGAVVRHAATREKRVIDEPIAAYIERMQGLKSWKVEGFGLAMPLDAKLRVSTFAAAK